MDRGFAVTASSKGAAVAAFEDVDRGLAAIGEATIRTTDLSHAYVEENSAYSS